MQEIKRRMVDRLTEAVHAGQREITGYSASDLMMETIPARLVTTDHILSLLVSGELPIFGQHCVGARIGPPKPPEATPERQHAVGPSGQQAGQPSAESAPEPATLTDTEGEEDLGEPAVAKLPAESPRLKSEMIRLALPRGRREQWNWVGLAELLKQEQRVFEDLTQFIEFCQANVQRKDNQRRVEDPEPTTVMRAIERWRLQDYAKIRGVNYNDDESS
jgi:hypothetical protein